MMGISWIFIESLDNNRAQNPIICIEQDYNKSFNDCKNA